MSEKVIIYKKYVGNVFAACESTHKLAELLDVAKHVSTITEQDAEELDSGESFYPSDAMIGDVFANVAHNPETETEYEKFETVESAEEALILNAIQTDAIVWFFGTIEELRAAISENRVPTTTAILRKGLEEIEPSTAW